MSELRKCPFCGGEAEFEIFGTICRVECKTCYCGTRNEHLDNYKHVIETWNSRTEQTG